jgi:hypothetical protein
MSDSVRITRERPLAERFTITAMITMIILLLVYVVPESEPAPVQDYVVRQK